MDLGTSIQQIKISQDQFINVSILTEDDIHPIRKKTYSEGTLNVHLFTSSSLTLDGMNRCHSIFFKDRFGKITTLKSKY